MTDFRDGMLLDDRYEIRNFIGKGGMALVYRAKDLRTGHDVAVKVLRPDLAKDEEFLERFDREASAASKMSHHNIVNLLDVGQADGLRYLVMEYVKGKTLKEVIRERAPLPPMIAGQIAIRILSALYGGECCVQDIADGLQMTPSAVSHQLKILKQSKLVGNRREGKQIFYFLLDDHVRSIIAIGLEHLRE